MLPQVQHTHDAEESAGEAYDNIMTYSCAHIVYSVLSCCITALHEWPTTFPIWQVQKLKS